MKKFKITLSIGYQSNVEDEITLEDLDVTEAEWKKMSADDRETVLEEYLKEWATNYIELGYKEIK